MRYAIKETFEREYIIYADSMDDALVKAHEIDDSWDYDEHSLGFTHIYEVETGKDMSL